MKKFSLLFIVFIFFNCQEDDICVEPTSPILTIGIYDSTTLNKKTLDTLWILYYENSNVVDTLKFYNTDSVQIPLRTDDGLINFGCRISTQLDSDSLNMIYTPNIQYVSKACGFKKIYKDVNYQFIKQTSITNFKVNTQAIENNNETNIYLYY